MKIVKIIALVGLAASVAGCVDNKTDKTVDRGIDAKDLSQLKAGIWVDPNGCQHWIIDDGAEGYLSQRLDSAGKPVCSDDLPTGYAYGDFKGGSGISDPI